METPENKFELTGILIKDREGEGFTGYIAELPEVIAEGNNEEEIMSNLMDAFKIVLKYKSEQFQKDSFGDDDVIEKKISLELV